jgi:uncharacterized membrane protein
MAAVITADQALDQATASTRVRLDSIDLLRGLVMVLMALDHVRDYFTELRFDPVDLSQTYPALFVTRWITHFCAPTFVLLAGTSAWFVSQRRDRASLSRFLLSRGLWLIALEFTVVNFAWTFDATYRAGLGVQVIWAIGCSMVVLSVLVRLPVAVVGAFGLLMIFGHNAFDGIKPEAFGAWAPLWTILHVQGPTPFMFVAYPLIPWIGVMAAGYALGSVYALPEARRRRTLVLLGAGAIGLFVVLRGLNVYGDLVPWSTQATPTLNAMAFMNLTKYPPSLLYLLATLGPALLALVAFEHARGPAARFLVTIGRVPLFFYVLHIALAHLLAGLAALALGFGPEILTNPPWQYSPGWGFGLLGVYGIWIAVVFALYPACRWFAGIKARRRDWWLSYL